MNTEYRKKYYQEYKKSKKGLIAHIYNGQLSSSRRRGHPVPSYTLNELRNFLLNDKQFNFLFEKWIQNNCSRELVPSVDRIDPTLPYTLTNINVMQWSENRKKRFSDCSHVPKSDNTSEITGVSYHKKSQKWVSQIIFKQTHIWLGQYITKENAIYSRHIAEQILKLNNYNIPITHPMYEKILKYIKKKCDPF